MGRKQKYFVMEELREMLKEEVAQALADALHMSTYQLVEKLNPKLNRSPLLYDPPPFDLPQPATIKPDIPKTVPISPTVVLLVDEDIGIHREQSRGIDYIRVYSSKKK